MGCRRTDVEEPGLLDLPLRAELVHPSRLADRRRRLGVVAQEPRDDLHGADEGRTVEQPLRRGLLVWRRGDERLGCRCCRFGEGGGV